MNYSRALVAFCCAITLGATDEAFSWEPAKRPNVLFIMALARDLHPTESG